MSARVLCVDDDPNALAAYQRALRKVVAIDVAQGGEEGLRQVLERGPYAVVVADMHMPGMDGIQFLSRVKERAPDTVRMMLTGADDQRTAVAAVNEGNIFRFLTKPCPPDLLTRVLEDGVRQYRLVTAERELLEKTLGGCLRVLTEMLSLYDAQSFGRAQSLRDSLRAVAGRLGVADTWEIEVAAMLAHMGAVTIPPEVALRARNGHALSGVEKDMLARTPEVGSRLLANIPRFEGVSRIVLYQRKRFDGTGFPSDGTSGETIPLGARILAVVGDMASLQAQGMPPAQALGILKGRHGHYDPKILQAAETVLAPPRTEPAQVVAGGAIRQVTVKGLRPGQVLRSDIQTTDGKVLIATGYTISETLLERIANFARLNGIKEPIMVEDEPTNQPG